MVAPVSVIPPPVVIESAPLTVPPARITACVPLSSVKLLVANVLNVIAPSRSDELNVILAPVASVVKLDVPVTRNVALSAIVPPFSTVNAPLIVPVRVKALVSLSIDTSPEVVPVVFNVTVPPKLLAALLKSIFVSVPVEEKLDVPVTTKAPVCEIAPLVVIEEAPLTVPAARITA